MRTLLVTALMIGGLFWIGGRFTGEYFAEPQSATAAGEPLVEFHPTETPAPATTPEPSPTLAHTDAVRVNFLVGTYGTTLQVEGTQSFVLWMAVGQTMRIAGQDGMAARLTAPSGADVELGADGALLPESGDYALTVAGTDSVSVDVR